MSVSTRPSPATPAAFADLLQTAVSEPGLISRAYSQFHDYSMGNVLLAAFQCAAREMPFGPIATYPHWQALGRQVRKGEKAITLCQPVTIRAKAPEAATPGAEPDAEGPAFLRFVYRPAWFVLAQTDGQDLPPAEAPEWDRSRALEQMGITLIPFDHHNGNVMGFARARNVAINPVNPRPIKTLFHELAHVLLGHTVENPQTDSDVTPRNLREAEAESVALLCCEALSLSGADEARGYIQHWYGTGNPIPERSAQRILRVADQIIRAGRPDPAAEGDASGEGGRS